MAAVLGIPRKEVLSRSFLRKTLSWGMTGKNVDTLNTKSCLNMIYNGLFIPTLPGQSSSVVVGTQRFLLRCSSRISESRQYNPVLVQWSWKSAARFVTFLHFTISLRPASVFVTLCRQQLFAALFHVIVTERYTFDEICVSLLVRLQRVTNLTWRERIKLKRLIILNYVEKNESALAWLFSYQKTSRFTLQSTCCIYI